MASRFGHFSATKKYLFWVKDRTAILERVAVHLP